MRHAEKYPVSSVVLSGKRERMMLAKENNFKQPGERFRSFDAARQERFVGRWVGMLSHPR